MVFVLINNLPISVKLINLELGPCTDKRITFTTQSQQLKQMVNAIPSNMGAQPRITDIIRMPQYTFSFEVTPNIEDIDLIENLPNFYAITWHAKNHKCKDLNIPPIKLAEILVGKKQNVLMHISCDLLKKSFLTEVLKKLMSLGITNILIIRGESYELGSSDFLYAKDLLKYIRQSTGNHFCIGVAGYPTCDEQEMQYLKHKVDMGADFIITQALCDTAEQLKSIAKSLNLQIPQSFKEFVTSTDSCGDLIVKNLSCESRHCSQFKIHCHYFTMNNLPNLLNLLTEISTSQK